jgi:hypothetical protein
VGCQCFGAEFVGGEVDGCYVVLDCGCSHLLVFSLYSSFMFL